MTVSVRMDPLLEKELELAAKSRGMSKSQFIIEAVQKSLGRKNPYDLMMALKAEEPVAPYGATDAPYETDSAKAALVAQLKDKHRASSPD